VARTYVGEFIIAFLTVGEHSECFRNNLTSYKSAYDLIDGLMVGAQATV
jgi:hypothetical protein